ncbi:MULTISPECIES: type III pantothenate kinase [unclassified Alteromonas]|uniref:type III pantothenate kinase n=1 Tax=unclassified Alteromonas TaxID=2614992 RepID=UPI001E371597|nr:MULTISPECIES: type III pantothenate kinase [unclassified Alteromonas]
MLLVDVGNTLIKYALLSNVHEEPKASDSLESLFSFVDVQKNITHLYIASVRNQDMVDEISTMCAARNIAFVEKQTEKEAFGIKNSYANVQKMGVDRWLAMICAAEKTKKAFFVMDVGTAITVDFVVDGQHLGGWIVPGFNVMRDALVASTKKVFANDEIPTSFGVGTDTEECVATGCHAAVYGVYLSAVDYISSKQTEFDIILGGGDKKVFAFLESAVNIRPAHLVVQGLARYARKELSDFLA